MGLGVGLRLLEWPAWNSPATQYGGLPVLPSFDAYGWLAGARCVGHLTGQPLSLFLHTLAALLPVPLESIAFYLPVALSSLAAWPMIRLVRGLGTPEAGLGAAVCVVLTPAYVYRTRLGFCDTDMLLMPLACVALCGMTLWNLRPDAPPAGKVPLSGRTSWSWLLPAGSLAMLHWIHPGFRPVAATMGLLFVLSAWPIARTSRCSLAACVAIALAALAGPWGILAGMAVCLLAAAAPVSRNPLAGWWPWIFLMPLLATLAWAMPDIARLAWQSALFFLHPFTNILSTPHSGVQDIAASVLEAQTPGWLATARQGAFHWMVGLVAALAYAVVLWRHPRLLPSLPLAALAVLAPFLGIRFAMYGGLVTGLGLPPALAMAWRRMGRKAGIGWLLQGLLVAFVAVAAWRDAKTLFPVPILSPQHAEALTRLDAIATSDAQIWTWWDYGYAAQFLARRRSFADPGNNTGTVLCLLSQALAADDPVVVRKTLLHGASLQRLATPSAWSQLTCPGVVRTNAPFPDGVQADAPALPAGPLPEQYLVVSWEGLRTGRWPLWFAASQEDRKQAEPGPWPLTAVAPKRLNIDEGWAELDEGVFALAELDIVNATGGHRHRSWPRDKGLAAVLNLGNAELLLFDRASRKAMFVRLLVDQAPADADHFELVVDRAPWTRIYRVRP